MIRLPLSSGLVLETAIRRESPTFANGDESGETRALRRGLRRHSRRPRSSTELQGRTVAGILFSRGGRVPRAAIAILEVPLPLPLGLAPSSRSAMIPDVLPRPTLCPHEFRPDLPAAMLRFAPGVFALDTRRPPP